MAVPQAFAGKKVILLAVAAVVVVIAVMVIPSLIVNPVQAQRQKACLLDDDLDACIVSCGQDHLYEACQIACDGGDAASCAMEEQCDTSPDVVCYDYAVYE